MRPVTTRVGFAKLLDWHEGLLTDVESKQVEKALDEGGALLWDLGWIEAFSRLRQGIQLGNAPEDLLKRIYAQFEVRRRDPQLIRCFVAVLGFDNRVRLQPLSVRNGVAEASTKRSR